MQKLIYFICIFLAAGLAGCDTGIGDADSGIAPCSANLTDNTLTVDGSKLTFTSNNVYYTAPYNGGDFYEYRVSLPSPYRYLYIRLSADKEPTENRTYFVTESSAAESPRAGYAYLSVETEDGIFYYSGESDDNLYVTVKDGATTFDLCDLDMFHYADYKFGMTGRIVYGKAPEQQDCTEPFSDNVLTMNGSKLTFTPGDINYTSPNSGGDFHEFRITLPSPYRTLYIRLSADKAPTESRTYSITESTAASSPGPGYAYMSVLDENGTFYYTGKSNDKLNVIVENGKITFDLCDIDMFYYYTYKFGITGRIAYGTAATTPAPCSASLISNVLIANGTRLDFTASNVHYASPNGSGNFHEYTVDLPSPYRMLYIRLAADATPTENRTYLITESSAASSPKSGYAYMSVLAADGTFYYTGESNDKLYVTSQNGAITFDLCDIDMFYYYTYKFGLTGRVEYRR